MTTSLVRTARFALLLLAGFALGLVAIATAGGKNGFLGKMIGISSASSGSSLASASCDIPAKGADKDVYFVSCGGFF